MCGLKLYAKRVRKYNLSHTSCRCVDWNIVLVLTSHRKTCHTSCRCVDWNMSITLLPPSTQVTPHVGVWIETVDYSGIAQGLGHTSCRCVDWNLTVNVRRYTRLVTPHVGVWIETSVASNKGQANAGHTSCRCVDWNFAKVKRTFHFWSHTSCRCVDWNISFFV